MAENPQDHSKMEFGDKNNLETAQYLKNEIFSWICGFREVFTDTLYYHFQSKKVGVNDLDFRQKSKNLIFDHIFEIF